MFHVEHRGRGRRLATGSIFQWSVPRGTWRLSRRRSYHKFGRLLPRSAVPLSAAFCANGLECILEGVDVPRGTLLEPDLPRQYEFFANPLAESLSICSTWNIHRIPQPHSVPRETSCIPSWTLIISRHSRWEIVVWPGLSPLQIKKAELERPQPLSI